MEDEALQKVIDEMKELGASDEEIEEVCAELKETYKLFGENDA